MRIFNLDINCPPSRGIKIFDLDPADFGGADIQIFSLDPENNVDITIWDLNPADDSGEEDIHIFIPGPPGPEGPPGPGGSLKTKAGILSAGSFTGSPRKSSVTFITPFSSTAYGITLTGEDSRIFTYSLKTSNGFTVSANSNGALTGEVSWVATASGETT